MTAKPRQGARDRTIEAESPDDSATRAEVGTPAELAERRRRAHRTAPLPIPTGPVRADRHE